MPANQPTVTPTVTVSDTTRRTPVQTSSPTRSTQGVGCYRFQLAGPHAGEGLDRTASAAAGTVSERSTFAGGRGFAAAVCDRGFERRGGRSASRSVPGHTSDPRARCRDQPATAGLDGRDPTRPDQPRAADQALSLIHISEPT